MKKKEKNNINVISFCTVVLILFFSVYTYAQEKIELKKADKLTGKVIDGYSVREATGNVHFIHNNVNVYCNYAIQYIDLNKVELTGNVRIYQDTLSLFTAKAVYFGNEQMAICENGVTLKEPNSSLSANGGIYYFNDGKAIFKKNVRIDNPTYILTSDELTYFRYTEDSYAKGNVRVKTDSALITAEYLDYLKRQGKTFAYVNAVIESDSTIIKSDTLRNNSFEKTSFASGNVRINNLRNNTLIFGNYAENYELKNYSFIRGNSRLVKFEEKDTLYISGNILEAYREKPERYNAKENVEILRGKFSGRSGNGVFSKTTEEGKEWVSMNQKPVVWQDNIQMTGDSIYAFIEDGKLRKIFAKRLPETENSVTSFLILTAKDSLYQNRNDQISGTDIEIEFAEEKIVKVTVTENSTSLYFLYEDNEPNGMNFVEGENMLIFFDEEQKVSRIRVEKNPSGKFTPEEKINMQDMLLPGYKLQNNRPEKQHLVWE